MRTHSLLRLGTATLLVAGLASAASAQTTTDDVATGRNLVLERIVVRVNGEIITQTDLEARQVSAIRARGVQPTTNAEIFQLLAEVTPQVIANAVDEMLLVQRGKELGYQLSDEQFRDFVDNMKEENGFETDEELVEVLDQQEGMTLIDFRRLIENQMLASQVQQIEILGRVAITDVEAKEYYDSHIEEFTEPATVTLREILIAAPEATEGLGLMAERQARDRATAVRQRITDGEEVGAVAAEVSDSPSKAAGGLIGPLELASIAETLREVIDTLEVGGVSEVLRTPQGYQILTLEARVDDTVQSFEDVRDEISTSVFNDRRLAEYADYLESLRDEAIIDWKNEELRQAYEEYRANPPAQPLVQ